MKKIFCMALCLFLFSYGICQDRLTEVFSVHPDGRTVIIYNDANLSSKRMEVYPYAEESMAGVMLYVKGETGNALAVIIGPEILYIRKGTVAVNTRNYDGSELLLYEEPHEDAAVVFHDTREQTVLVYGIHDKWLYVEAINAAGQRFRGWLPPDMQCGSPWTSCC